MGWIKAYRALSPGGVGVPRWTGGTTYVE